MSRTVFLIWASVLVLLFGYLVMFQMNFSNVGGAIRDDSFRTWLALAVLWVAAGAIAAAFLWRRPEK